MAQEKLWDVVTGAADVVVSEAEAVALAAIEKAVADPLGALECAAYVGLSTAAVAALVLHIARREYVCPIAVLHVAGYSTLTALKLWA